MIKEIPNFPNYFASEDGEIFHKLKIGKFRKLKPQPDHYGYLQISLKNDVGKRKKVSLHRIIAITFLGPPPFEDAVVRHFPSNDKTNCRLNNLRWGDYKSNENDKILQGTALFGEKAVSAKLSEKQVEKIKKELAEGKNYKELAKNNNVSINTIKKIESGLYWSHMKTKYINIKCLLPMCKKAIKTEKSYANKFCNESCAAKMAAILVKDYEFCIYECGWHVYACRHSQEDTIDY